MYRIYHPNLVPVTNKYLAQKQFIKDRKDLKNNIKNAHGLIDQSPPTPRPHCSARLRQKQIREYELEMIEHENQRMRTRISTNGGYVNSHNDYVMHSLNIEKRQRDETRHKSEFKRLQKQISQVRTNYPTREYEHDFAKQQYVKRQISRYPTTNK